MEIEDAHHPLQGAGKAGGLIGHRLSSGESKLERNGLVGVRVLYLGELLQYPRGLMMAPKGSYCRIGGVGSKSIEPVLVLEQSDLVALLVELIGSC